MITLKDPDPSELRAWANDPISRELLRLSEPMLDAAVKRLINQARGSTDPRIVQVAEECWNLQATMQMLAGRLVEKTEKEEIEDG